MSSDLINAASATPASAPVRDEGARGVVDLAQFGATGAPLVEQARGYRVALVASDKPDAPGLASARERGLRAIGFPTPTRAEKREYEQALDRVLREAGVEVIALAGYMRLLSDEFVARWRGRILNIHPSLLPLFKGTHTHAQALAAGVRLHGCTVHYVVPELDAGPIVAQAAVPVSDDDEDEVDWRDLV